MKKVRKFLACLLACMLMVSLFATTANAASYGESSKVYVDDSRVTNLSAYVDKNGDIRVLDDGGIHRIFPDETEDISILPTSDGILVKEWVEYFSYTYTQDGNKMYIYTDERHFSIPSIEETPPILVLFPDDNKGQHYDSPAEVFVNGMRINNVGAYLSDGEAYIDNYQVLYTLFPKETIDTYFPTAREATTLKSWADRYGYTYNQNGVRVYLNNNGNIPVEVQLNGTTVSFADQQPVILPPGRTMVPIRTISELVGCSVEWDGAHNRVIIQKGNTKLILWINNTSYWIKSSSYPDGKYFKMDVVPQVINGRTMVPLRLISEAYGFNVSYDSSGNVGVVKLSSK